MSAPTKVEMVEQYMSSIDATPQDCLEVGLSNIAAGFAEGMDKEGHATISVVLSCDYPEQYEELCELAYKLKMMVEHTPFEAEVRNA